VKTATTTSLFQTWRIGKVNRSDRSVRLTSNLSWKTLKSLELKERLRPFSLTLLLSKLKSRSPGPRLQRWTTRYTLAKQTIFSRSTARTSRRLRSTIWNNSSKPKRTRSPNNKLTLPLARKRQTNGGRKLALSNSRCKDSSLWLKILIRTKKSSLSVCRHRPIATNQKWVTRPYCRMILQITREIFSQRTRRSSTSNIHLLRWTPTLMKSRVNSTTRHKNYRTRGWSSKSKWWSSVTCSITWR
jgi:hypothetical protein